MTGRTYPGWYEIAGGCFEAGCERLLRTILRTFGWPSSSPGNDRTTERRGEMNAQLTRTTRERGQTAWLFVVASLCLTFVGCSGTDTIDDTPMMLSETGTDAGGSGAAAADLKAALGAIVERQGLHIVRVYTLHLNSQGGNA